MDDLRDNANRKLEQALRETGAPDPRQRLREMLKALRERDAEAFKSATRHFEESVIPAVAADGGDPIGEWIEYGRLLAGFIVEGETVRIDPAGLSSPYRRPVALSDMVLHLPKSPRMAALAIALPPRPSPAQQATYALLVEEAVRLP